MKPVKKNKKNTKHESKSLFKMALNWKIGNPIKGKYKKKNVCELYLWPPTFDNIYT